MQKSFFIIIKNKLTGDKAFDGIYGSTIPVTISSTAGPIYIKLTKKHPNIINRNNAKIIFLKNFINNNTSSILIPLRKDSIKNKSVVKIVIITPKYIGISKIMFKAIAVPNTSS